MKIAFGAAVMILMASMPAYAQSRGASSVANQGGGASGGMGSGSVSAPVMPALQSTPRYSPIALEVSGSDESFYPSTFVAFDQAVAQGKVELISADKTIVQAAATARNAAKQHARIEIVQDDRGNARIATN